MKARPLRAYQTPMLLSLLAPAALAGLVTLPAPAVAPCTGATYTSTKVPPGTRLVLPGTPLFRQDPFAGWAGVDVAARVPVDAKGQATCGEGYCTWYLAPGAPLPLRFTVEPAAEGIEIESLCPMSKGEQTSWRLTEGRVEVVAVYPVTGLPGDSLLGPLAHVKVDQARAGDHAATARSALAEMQAVVAACGPAGACGPGVERVRALLARVGPRPVLASVGPPRSRSTRPGATGFTALLTGADPDLGVQIACAGYGEADRSCGLVVTEHDAEVLRYEGWQGWEGSISWSTGAMSRSGAEAMRLAGDALRLAPSR